MGVRREPGTWSERRAAISGSARKEKRPAPGAVIRVTNTNRSHSPQSMGPRSTVHQQALPSIGLRAPSRGLQRRATRVGYIVYCVMERCTQTG